MAPYSGGIEFLELERDPATGESLPESSSSRARTTGESEYRTTPGEYTHGLLLSLSSAKSSWAPSRKIRGKVRSITWRPWSPLRLGDGSLSDGYSSHSSLETSSAAGAGSNASISSRSTRACLQVSAASLTIFLTPVSKASNCFGSARCLICSIISSTITAATTLIDCLASEVVYAAFSVSRLQTASRLTDLRRISSDSIWKKVSALSYRLPRVNKNG